MRHRLWIILAAPLLLAADPPADDAAKKEWAALEGTWTITKLDLAGKSMLEPHKPPPQLVIKDGKVRGKNQPKDPLADVTFRLDPGRKPKTISGAVEGGLLTVLGIYALDGDELKVCMTIVETARAKEREKERPAEFDSAKGILLVFKRVKQ